MGKRQRTNANVYRVRLAWSSTRRLKYHVVMVEVIKEWVVEEPDVVTVTSRGCQAESGRTAADPFNSFLSY